MRGQAMKKICKKISDDGYDFSKMIALEFFAREGDWQTTVYANLVYSLEVWEVDSVFKNALMKNLPEAKIRIGNSYEYIKEPQYIKSFDFVVCDNPNGIFGLNNEFCDHFEALPLILPTLKDLSILIFNINDNPFNFEKFIEWQKKRNKFYNLVDSSSIRESFFIQFYSNYFIDRGYLPEKCFIERRNDEWLAYIVFILRRDFND